MQLEWPEKYSDVDEVIRPLEDLTGEVQIRWHSGYWDGPLSGYAALRGYGGYWFHCIDEMYNVRNEKADEEFCVSECPDRPGGGKCCFKEWDRLYLVFELTGEQEAIELYNHGLFREYVGVHTDYDDDGNSPIGKLRPRSEMDKFYKMELEQAPPLQREQVVGYTLSLMPNGGYR